MRRRDFITLLGGAAAAWPVAARAQQGEALPHVAYAGSTATTPDDPDAQERLMAFRMGLAKLGWADGRNVRIDFIPTAGGHEREVAAELVRSAPAVVLSTGTPMTAALRLETRAIPIVFVAASDPQGSGLVASMMRPAGNLTGFTNYLFSMGGKWLEMLKDAAPSMRRVLVLLAPGNLAQQGFLRDIQSAGLSLSVEAVPAAARDRAEIERAFEAFARQEGGGLLALPGAPGLSNSELTIALAERYRLPAMYTHRFFAPQGGLMSYDTDLGDLYRRAAFYVDRILKGVRPGDLPVQLPTKYDLVVNLKVAKTLGLTIPLPLLASADEVIE